MGKVYLAEDISLRRKVALKFLPDSFQCDEVARRRFLREAQSAAALEHPYAYFLATDRAGHRLIYSTSREDWDIWRMPGPGAVGSFKPEPFIRSTRNEGHPKYSPDGAYVAFNSDRSGAWDAVP
jgi:serine/threonine protein kinase